MEESNTFQDDITINSMRSQIETPLGEEKSTIADKLEKLKRGKPKNSWKNQIIILQKY